MDQNILLLIADYCSGTISRRDMSALREWVGASAQNQAQFQEYLNAHRAGMELKILTQLDEERSWQRLMRKLSRNRTRNLNFMRAAVAAAVIVISGGASFWIVGMLGTHHEALQTVMLPGEMKATLMLANGEAIALDEGSILDVSARTGITLRQDSLRSVVYSAEASEYHTVDVPRGGEFRFTLPDGSRIWLNSATKFRFPTSFTGATREVFLEGEAYFAVEKDEKHPFVVRTEHGTVNVLGTEFNVSVYPDDRKMVTSLRSGRVEMTVNGGKAVLSPGQQAVWEKGREGIGVSDTDLSSAFSWIKGEFEFEDLSLREILTYVSRWYDVRFEFADGEIADLRFTGGARKYAPLDDFLKVIERSYDIRFIRKGATVQVVRK